LAAWVAEDFEAQKLLDDGSGVATVSMSRSLSYSFGQTRSMWRL
jgi:hypothetical protein